MLWIAVVSRSQHSEKGSYGRLTILDLFLPHHSSLQSPIDRTPQASLNQSEALLNLYKILLSLFRAFLLTIFILTQDIVFVLEKSCNSFLTGLLASSMAPSHPFFTPWMSNPSHAILLLISLQWLFTVHLGWVPRILTSLTVFKRHFLFQIPLVFQTRPYHSLLNFTFYPFLYMYSLTRLFWNRPLHNPHPSNTPTPCVWHGFQLRYHWQAALTSGLAVGDPSVHCHDMLQYTGPST